MLADFLYCLAQGAVLGEVIGLQLISKLNNELSVTGRMCGYATAAFDVLAGLHGDFGVDLHHPSEM